MTSSVTKIRRSGLTRSGSLPYTVMAAAVVGIAAVAAHAEYVTLIATDTGEQSSFASALHWSNGAAPDDDHDYQVADNRQMRTPNDGTTRTFAGRSLTLGATNFSSKGDITLRTKRADTGAGGRIYINNLNLYGGQIAVGVNYTCWLGGTVTVYSPLSDPFLYWTPGPIRVIETAQAFTGAEGTGLTFKGPGAMAVGGANANYLGGWLFDNLQMTLNHRDALGGELSAPDAASIRLVNGARFVITSDLCIPATRGITMEDPNGATFLIGRTSTILAPITGNGPLTITGGSTLRYGGAFSAPGLIVNGKLSLTNGFTMAETSTFTLNRDATLEVAAPDFRPAVYNFTGKSGKLLINASVSGATGCVDFRGTFALEGKMSIFLNNPVATNRLAVATIPVASGTVTADDFEIADFWHGIGVEGIEVQTVDGMQTVYLKTVPYVHAVDGSPAFCLTASHWSDGQEVHAGEHYCVQGRDVRRGGPDGGTYDFPGESLTLFNPYQTVDNAKQYVIKQTLFTCNDFQGYDGGGIAFGGGNAAGTEQTFAGHLTVKTQPTGYFRFNGDAFRVNLVEASVSGYGRLFCMGRTTYKFVADNSAYLGSMHVNGYREGSILGLSTLVVTNECNLGGNPATFTADALAIQTRGIFRPGCSLTLDDENRGMVLQDGGQIWTDPGVTLSTRLPMTWIGTSSKIGDGVWDLGGTARAASDGPLLVVSNGTLRAGSARPLVGASLTFAADAKFEADYVADPEDERATYGLVVNGTLTIEGASLPVTVSLTGPAPSAFTQPLFTVWTDAAATVMDKLALVEMPTYRSEIVTQESAFGGAAMTTISAKFTKRGFAVFIQ